MNWIDIVVLLLVMRCVYAGVRNGLTIELFRFLGVITGLIAAIHYYSKAAEIFIVNFGLPEWLCQFAAFLVISQTIRLVFKYGIALALKILNIQFLPQLEKPGGGIIGFGRGLILSGTLLLAFGILPSVYLEQSIYDKSFSGKFLIDASEKTYKSLTFWMPEETTKKGIFR
ncbi:MAG: CvpA family protein [Candidatus Omnitrophota bacterium]